MKTKEAPKKTYTKKNKQIYENERKASNQMNGNPRTKEKQATKWTGADINTRTHRIANKQREKPASKAPKKNLHKEEQTDPWERRCTNT